MTKMKAFLRVMRALFIRLMFMAYMLLCIWRVTFVSDNKYYWLMIISVGFLLIETAILLWLRTGKEFRGILPSVLFFLSCVIPSIWIMCVDEASRKNKFHSVAENQENKIKDYVLSLDIVKVGQNGATTSNTGLGSPRAHYINATRKALLSTLLTTTSKPVREARSIVSYSPMPASFLKNSKRLDSEKIDKTVECCDVKISYWFQEDNFQHLFFQSLMLILVSSRWLITRSELNLNQRSLILVVSVATAADTLDFFSYLNMEIVYRNNYLLFSVLLILTLSLIQFVFLHLEESITFNTSKNINQETNEDVESIKDHKIQNKKEKLSFINKHYRFLKKHLKADSTLPRTKQQYPFERVSKPSLANHQSPKKRSPKRFLCVIFCCCLQQQDPLFFILLAGLFLHDGSYLTFRIFSLSKLGWETILNHNPLLVFFMIKNILIIVTQIYKVYTVSNEKRQKKLLENYRDFVMAHQENINNPNGNFLPPNQIAAAATGGQVPLVPINSFPNFNKQGYQQNNPYRFAQIYAENGPQVSGNRGLNRSMSTLSANTGFFADNNSNFKTATLQDSRNSEYGNGYYQNNPSIQSSGSYQFQQQSLNTESMVGPINKEYGGQNYILKQQYDSNITMCQNIPTQTNMSTPINPFSAKVGKALYGLPFMSRSKTSLSGQETTNGTNNSGFVSTFRNSSFNQSNKNLKASKI